MKSRNNSIKQYLSITFQTAPSIQYFQKTLHKKSNCMLAEEESEKNSNTSGRNPRTISTFDRRAEALFEKHKNKRRIWEIRI